MEIYVYLHSQGNGVTEVSPTNTVGYRRKLPTHELELIPDPEVPRRVLLKAADSILMAYDLMPKKLIGGAQGDSSDSHLIDAAVKLAADRALDREFPQIIRARDPAGTSQQGITTAVRTRFRPAAEPTGLLASHRAKTESEQIQTGFEDVQDEG